MDCFGLSLALERAWQLRASLHSANRLRLAQDTTAKLVPPPARCARQETVVMHLGHIRRKPSESSAIAKACGPYPGGGQAVLRTRAAHQEFRGQSRSHRDPLLLEEQGIAADPPQHIRRHACRSRILRSVTVTGSDGAHHHASRCYLAAQAVCEIVLDDEMAIKAALRSSRRPFLTAQRPDAQVSSTF